MHNPPFQEVARVDQEGVGGPTRCGAKCSRKMRIVSLIDEGGCHRAHPAPSRARARAGALRHRPALGAPVARSRARARHGMRSKPCESASPRPRPPPAPPGPPSRNLASRLLSPPLFTPRRRRSPRSSPGVPHGRSALPRRRRAGPRARRGTRARPACPSRSRLRTRGP